MNSNFERKKRSALAPYNDHQTHKTITVVDRRGNNDHEFIIVNTVFGVSYIMINA